MKLKIENIIYFIWMAFYVEPSFFSSLKIESIYSSGRIIIFFVTFIILMLKMLKQKRIFKHFDILLALYIFYIFLFISTINSPTGDFNSFWRMAIRDIGLSNVMFLWLHNDLKSCIKSTLFYLQILVTINLFTVIVFKNGLYSIRKYTGYFLGYDNTHIRWLVPTCFLSLLNEYINEKNDKRSKFKIHFSTIYLLIISIISVSISKSSTSIVAVILLILLLFCIRSNQNDSIINFVSYKNAIIISLIGSFIIFLMTQDYFLNLLNYIGSIFKKNMISLRLNLWVAAVEQIKNRPLLGYGFELTEIISMKFTHSLIQGSSAHNYIINTIYQCGFIGFIFFCNIYRIVGNKIKQYKNNVVYKYISIIFIIIAVMGLTEPQHNSVLLYVVIIVSCFIQEIINERSIEINEKH